MIKGGACWQGAYMLHVRRQVAAHVHAEALDRVDQPDLGKAQDAVQVAQALGVLKHDVAVRHPHDAVYHRPAGTPAVVGGAESVRWRCFAEAHAVQCNQRQLYLPYRRDVREP